MPNPTIFRFILLVLLFLIIGLYVVVKKSGIKQGYEQGRIDFCDELNRTTYQKRIAEFQSLNQIEHKPGIVFVGDSLIQEYPVHEYFSSLDVYNRGIYGDTTTGLLQHLNDSVFDLHPKAIILLIGVNDFTVLEAKPFEIYERIETITKTINEQLPSCKIWVLSLLPVSKQLDPQINHQAVGIRNNNQIDEVNCLLYKSKCFDYIDINTTLKDETGNLQLDYTQEGIHLSSKGYEHLTRILTPIIEAWYHEVRSSSGC